MDHVEDFAEQVVRHLEEMKQDREEATRRGRKIEASILRFCRESGLDLDSDGGLAGWRDALVLNEIEIYETGIEFDLEGFLSGLEFQSKWTREISSDAWHLACNGGWCAEGYWENPTFLIPEFAPTCWNPAVLHKKQFLWSLTLHFWRELTAGTGKPDPDPDPVEQAGQEETSELPPVEESESKPARPRLGQKLTPEQIGFIQGAGHNQTKARIVERFEQKFGFSIARKTVQKYRNADPKPEK